MTKYPKKHQQRRKSLFNEELCIGKIKEIKLEAFAKSFTKVVKDLTRHYKTTGRENNTWTKVSYYYSYYYFGNKVLKVTNISNKMKVKQKGFYIKYKVSVKVLSKE